MASSESESLFSFEVAVEYLRVDAATVACRFPAVAIRLLDFPTLLIPNLEKDERDRFKTSFLFDSYEELPLRFKELLDSKGNFQFNKGKSCMFKFDLTALHDHLQNVPLYAMITDLWGDVAKLVGVSTIPLSDIIARMKNDVHLKGLSYPSVHGQKDTFPVFNLMGSQVGVVSLGYRLLSLGTSLIPHIPASSIFQGSKQDGRESSRDVDLSLPRKQPVDHVGDISKEAVKETPHPQHSLQQKADPETCIISGDIVLQNPNYLTNSAGKIQQDLEHINQETQTNFKRDNENRGTRRVHVNEYTDVGVVSNTHCPPPLIFNAQWDSKVKKSSTVPERNLYDHDKRQFSVEEPSWSDSSESYPSKSVELNYRLQDVSPEKVRKVVKRSTGKRLDQMPPQSTNKAPHQDLVRSETAMTGGRTLPILTALLKELSILTGASSENEFQKGMEEFLMESKENIQPSLLDPEHESNNYISTPGYNAQPDASQAPHHQKHQSCRHKHCAKLSKPVPSAKGWLRQEPVFNKRETKLHFKMTYSQKLRLKKNNPEMLKTIEAEEERQSLLRNVEYSQEKTRINQKRKTRAKYSRSSSVHSYVSHPPDEPTAVARDRLRNLKGGTFKLPSRGRPPVPTPRISPTFEEQDDIILGQNKEQEPSVDKHGDFPPRSQHDRYDLTSSEKSSRSIEVFIPNPSLLESDADSGSEEEDLDNQEPEKKASSERKGAEVHPRIPGILTESPESESKGRVSRQGSNQSNHSQGSRGSRSHRGSYSDDSFDDSKSSYHTPRDESDDDQRKDEGERKDEEKRRNEEERLEMRSDEGTGSLSVSVSPEFTSITPESQKDIMSENDQTPVVHNDTDNSDHEEQSRDIKQRLLKRQENLEFEKVKSITKSRGREHLPPSVSSRLALPRPPLSSTSPIPQPRNPPSKIVMTKPMSINNDMYGESVEVNLPSDLSTSFDSHDQRPRVNPLESSQDGIRDSSINQSDRFKSLDVIQSESEDIDEDEQNDSKDDAYSEDFVSDFEDSDN